MRDVFVNLALLVNNSKCMNQYYARTPVDEDTPPGGEPPPTAEEFHRMILLMDSTSQRMKQELIKAQMKLQAEIDSLTNINE